jgi:hypothetical protein
MKDLVSCWAHLVSLVTEEKYVCNFEQVDAINNADL